MAWHDTVDRHKQQQQRMEEFLRPNFNVEYRLVNYIENKISIQKEGAEEWIKVDAKIDLLENGQYGATISNLSPKSSYQVRISAENEYGHSEAQIINVKTKGNDDVTCYLQDLLSAQNDLIRKG